MTIATNTMRSGVTAEFKASFDLLLKNFDAEIISLKDRSRISVAVAKTPPNA